jgi:membrane-associated phospholipid phosphatase
MYYFLIIHINRMDASSLTNRRRNLTIGTHYINNGTPKQSQDPETYQQRVVGVIEIGPPQTLQTPTATIDSAVTKTLEKVLQYAAKTNIGPTRCARLSYVWFASIVTGWNWITTSGPLSGNKDGWNWSVHHPLRSFNYQFIWMNRVLDYATTKLIPGFDGAYLYDDERSRLNLTGEQIAQTVQAVQTSAHWSTWQAAYDAWYTQRNDDNHVSAAVFPTTSELPNGGTFLDPAQTVDPASYPAPTRWTPLVLNGAPKRYLTYKWQTVRSSCLTQQDEKDISGAAAQHFTTSAAQRNAEIAEVLAISESLTDQQKVQAEFWAGGPGTVSPPGMFMWMWKELMLALQVAQYQSLDVFFYSGLELSINIFEASRMVWGLKLQFTEARPIQEIRRLYRGQSLTKYDGTQTTGESWVPYQEANFVTPPFPDFPSGHSAFSQAFASVMSVWFSPRIPTTAPESRSDLVLLSPSLNTQSHSFGVFVFPAGASGIQPGVVPANPITLMWETWQSMADSAGLSRKYGGIHATSAHKGSQALSKRLQTIVRSRWGF